MTLSFHIFFFAIYRWLHEINQNCDDVNRILVGNKCDDPDRRVVLKEDATRFSNQMGIQLFETSAKDGHNVDEIFMAISKKMSQNNIVNAPNVIQLEEEHGEKKSVNWCNR